MIKLFISDLDGTLLNQWHTSDSTINQGVTELKHRGYKVAVATGRHLRRHQRFGLKFLKEIDYIIAMNGALVLDHCGNALVKTAIDANVIQVLIEKFPMISFEYLTSEAILVQTSKLTHFKKGFKGCLTAKNISRALLNLTAGNFTYQVPKEQLINHDILKIECITNSKEIKEDLITFLEENSAHLSYAYNDDVHFEITGKNVNKKNGIVSLLKKIEIHPDRVAVYGNDSNDVEMLDYFLHSNAPSDAKATAKSVAKNIIGHSNQQSVIKHMLETARKQDAYKK